jgi:hypothetical protein
MHRRPTGLQCCWGPPWGCCQPACFRITSHIGTRQLLYRWVVPTQMVTTTALLYPPSKIHTAKATGPHDHELEQTQSPASKLTATEAAFFAATAVAPNCRRQHNNGGAPPAPHTHVFCQPRGPVPNCHPPEHKVDVCNSKSCKGRHVAPWLAACKPCSMQHS